MGWLDRERTIAPPGFNRWLVPPAALAVHLCIGQAYATSVYKTALVKHFGIDESQPFADLPEKFKRALINGTGDEAIPMSFGSNGELLEMQAKRVVLNDTPIMLYRRYGHIYAIGAVCSHAGGPLDEGKIDELG